MVMFKANSRTRWPPFWEVLRPAERLAKSHHAHERYGTAHASGFHGKITDTPSGPIFNYYLAQGYSYYFGDDFDLWITSDPFRPGEMDLDGPVKHKPITQEQMELGRGLITAIKSLSSCGITAAE